MKLDAYLSPVTKISSNFSKDLNVRLELMKLLEEAIWEIFQSIAME
jgi:hypothetical protein